MVADRNPYARQRFMSRAEFKAAHGGQDAPAFNPKLKIKRWEDSEALAAADGLPIVQYSVFMPNPATRELFRRNGSPVVYGISMPVEEAMAVNLPDEDGTGNTSIQEWMGPEIPCPILPLGEGEIYAFGDNNFTATGVWIRNVKLYEEQKASQVSGAGYFTEADRGLLKRMAAKLGVQ